MDMTAGVSCIASRWGVCVCGGAGGVVVCVWAAFVV